MGHSRMIVLGVVLCGCFVDVARAVDKPQSSRPAATRQLVARYPGLRVHQEGGRVLALYGRPMSTAATATKAASDWVANHAVALGVGNVDLRLTSARRIGTGPLMVFAYQQFVDDVPVEYGFAKVVVHDSAQARVVYAGARLAAAPEGGFARRTMSAPAVHQSIRRMPAFAGLTEWSQPQLVVYYGEGDDLGGIQSPVHAWKFTGSTAPDGGQDVKAFTFFVDVATGALVHARNEVYYAEVTGRVSGLATPGVLPDVGYNQPVEIPLAGLAVSIPGGDETFTDENGAFTLFTEGDDPVTIRATLTGPWVKAQTVQLGNHRVEQTVQPGAFVELLMNPDPTEFVTAQVNGFVQTMKVHSFYKTRQPDYSGLDFPIACNVNLADTCNAFFSPSFLSIHLFNAGDGCANTAYSSIIAHEYGHFVLHTLGVPQGAFGEGFGDSLVLMVYDDPVIARDIRGPGQHIRDIVEANVRYPCVGAIHACGQLLAGVWWDIKLALQRSLGETEGLEVARQLFTDWSQMTSGGLGSNSAHPGTAIEIFTVDDDDGDLDNGTPHGDALCEAFAARNIGCPGPPPIVFDYPDGLPTMIPPDEPSTVRVNVLAGMVDPVPGSGFLMYRVGDGSFTAVRMDEVAPNEYLAPLPEVPCHDTLDYYVSVLDNGIRRRFDPLNAPFRLRTAVSAARVDVLFQDEFESDRGWLVGSSEDDAVEGIWQRVDPVGTAAQPESDQTDDPGSLCWVTGQGVAGEHPGEDDVDDGQTTLRSPMIDLSQGDGVIGYWRWFSNNIGPARGQDVFVVDVSNDGGSTWTHVETVGPTGVGTTGGWFYHEFTVGDFVEPTASVRVRFVASDLDAPSIIEAAVDDFTVFRFECEPWSDCNENGLNDSDELRDNPTLDCNGNDVLDECDLAQEQSADTNDNGIPDECDCDVSLCFDDDPCTVDACDPDTGACLYSPGVIPYGDLDENGVVIVDDVLCTLSGFAGVGDCPQADIFPCAGDGQIDVDDVLAVLGAFAGSPGCPPRPCNP